MSHSPAGLLRGVPVPVGLPRGIPLSLLVYSGVSTVVKFCPLSSQAVYITVSLTLYSRVSALLRVYPLRSEPYPTLVYPLLSVVPTVSTWPLLNDLPLTYFPSFHTRSDLEAYTPGYSFSFECLPFFVRALSNPGLPFVVQ